MRIDEISGAFAVTSIRDAIKKISELEKGLDGLDVTDEDDEVTYETIISDIQDIIYDILDIYDGEPALKKLSISKEIIALAKKHGIRTYGLKLL